MSFAGTILRSRAVAALTSPHGVDRYLEQINPMWAANEVRARVLSVHRETGGEHPVATITLQPTSTWRGHRAGQYVQVGVDLPGSRRTAADEVTLLVAAPLALVLLPSPPFARRGRPSSAWAVAPRSTASCAARIAEVGESARPPLPDARVALPLLSGSLVALHT